MEPDSELVPGNSVGVQRLSDSSDHYESIPLSLLDKDAPGNAIPGWSREYVGTIYPKPTPDIQKATDIPLDVLSSIPFQRKIIGLPFRLEHEDQIGLGKVTGVGFNKATGTLVSFNRLQMDTPSGPEMEKLMKMGYYRGLSMGHKTNLLTGEYTPLEISAVRHPRRAGCYIVNCNEEEGKAMDQNNPIMMSVPAFRDSYLKGFGNDMLVIRQKSTSTDMSNSSSSTAAGAAAAAAVAAPTGQSSSSSSAAAAGASTGAGAGIASAAKMLDGAGATGAGQTGPMMDAAAALKMITDGLAKQQQPITINNNYPPRNRMNDGAAAEGAKRVAELNPADTEANKRARAEAAPGAAKVNDTAPARDTAPLSKAELYSKILSDQTMSSASRELFTRMMQNEVNDTEETKRRIETAQTEAQAARAVAEANKKEALSLKWSNFSNDIRKMDPVHYATPEMKKIMDDIKSEFDTNNGAIQTHRMSTLYESMGKSKVKLNTDSDEQIALQQQLLARLSGGQSSSSSSAAAAAAAGRTETKGLSRTYINERDGHEIESDTTRIHNMSALAAKKERTPEEIQTMMLGLMATFKASHGDLVLYGRDKQDKLIWRPAGLKRGSAGF